MRVYPLSCRGCFQARRESPFHRKQSWQAGQEYMHSCKTLVGGQTPNPGKEPPAAAFFIAPNGADARYCRMLSAASQISCPTAFQGSERPLPGDWGGPQQADFQFFRRGENRGNRKVCTALHCLPLLRADKREVCINPIGRT